MSLPTSSSKPTPTPTFKILYFASAASFTRKASENLPTPLALGALFGVLEGLYPGIKAKVLDSCAVVLNMDYVDVDVEGEEEGGGEVVGTEEGQEGGRRLVIKEGDEVGIIPPVSSG